MDSVFDPNSFLDATLEEPSERRELLPVGDYVAVVEAVKPGRWASQEKGTSGPKFDLTFLIDVPSNLQEQLGYTEPTLKLRDSIMLDVTEGGSIDNRQGKNNRLRLYREALDLNKPGDKFSARMMIGRFLMVKINYRQMADGTYTENVQTVGRQT